MSAPTLIARYLRSAGRAYLSWQRTRTPKVACVPQRRLGRAVLFAAACAASMSGTSLMLGIAPTLAQEQPRTDWVTLNAEAPTLAEALEALRKDGSVTPKNLIVRSGDTLTSVLARLGVDDRHAQRYIRSQALLRPLVLPQRGQYVSAGVLPDGRLAYLKLYLEGPHERDSRTVELTRSGDLFAAAEHAVAFDTLEESVSGTAGSSFSETVASLGIPDSVAEQLKDVWAGADNPVQQMRRGDSLRLIYERKFADGNFIRNGQLLAVQVVTEGDVHEAYWFADGVQAGGFYTLEGRASQQTFMRVPLDVQDVSSEFAPLRRHPVTGVLRPHNGTDFRAPSGSRIFAAADGVITFVGYERKGYGRYVKIDHGLGRTTLYAHMSKIQKGLRNGQRVERGQVIGYVGRSGLATGPHLHYELMMDGVQINPRTADLPDTENLSAFQLAQLRTQARPIQQRFDLLAESEARTAPTILRTNAARRRDAQAEVLGGTSDAPSVRRRSLAESDTAPAPH
ncbi:MAG: peptidoglycan DD-metalloendopeptidase family protein [Sutterella sp.]|nr:peptidoglycan DD-metalloendopeptidase family protein [Sutterella sp.]